MGGGCWAVPDRDLLFTQEFAVSGATARRILRHAKRKGLMVTVVGDRSSTEWLTSVVDQMSGDPYALLLDQPVGTPADQPVFSLGESIRMRWTEQGLHVGVLARVVRVDSKASPPIYEIHIDGGVFRLQRRGAYRVPIGPNDAVRALLSVNADSEPLVPIIKDLSTTGVLLSLDLKQALDIGLERYMRAMFTLQLPLPDSEEVTSELFVLWTERISDQRMDFGARWLEPSIDFTISIRRFIVRKEKLLLKRHGGG